MIEPGTPTWKGGLSHRSSTIDLVIASNSAQISMVEIATDLYTGSHHETLCWEINNGGKGFALSLVLFLSCSVVLLLLLSRCLFMFISLLVGPHLPNG
jgi:hypothetical protein